MFNDVLMLIVPISALWVYIDATNNKIGKIPDRKSFSNLSAGGWSIVTLGLWIIAFPTYLIKRKSLLELAKSHPVEVKFKPLKIIILIIFVTFGFLLNVSHIPSAHSTPNCSDSNTVSLVIQISKDELISQDPRLKSVFENNVLSLDTIRTTDINEKVDSYTCAANLVMSANGQKKSIPITYTSESTDNGDSFYVNVYGLN